jgi:uncharacterized membrane protein
MDRIAMGWEKRAEKAALWVAVGFSGAALLGFATFGVHPQLLSHFPWSVPIFAVSFRLFSIGQILVAGGAVCALLLLRARLRWIGAFLAVYFVSLGSELSGTAVGFPFGPYHYTTFLGPKWFGLVPIVIPLSWFMMAIPSFHFALKAAPGRGPVVQILLGAVILTLWDLALDPAMSYATPYWRWEVDGAYYGMPMVNLAGWLFTSLLIMGAFVLLRSREWVEKLPTRWLAIFYGANLILPLGMSVAAGLVWAVVITVAAYGALWVGIRGWQVGEAPGMNPALLMGSVDDEPRGSTPPVLEEPAGRP